MSAVAEQLRQARQAQNLTIQHVAEVTKIRTDHIRALEEGNFEIFSAAVYVRGFVRSYAALLKLNVPQLMAALDAELGRIEKFRETPSVTGLKRGPLDWVLFQTSRVNWRRAAVWLGILAVLLAAVFLLWRHFQSADQLKDAQPGLYEPARTSGDTLPLPPTMPRNP